MRLKDVVRNTNFIELPGHFSEIEISHITDDSRKVKAGSLFVAIKGPDRDGADYISKAVEKGAKVIVKNGNDFKAQEENGVLIIPVPDSLLTLEQILKNFYNDVSSRLKVIGITGTNGKTTITYILESIFNNAGLPCGVIGTINCRYGEKNFDAHNTTPGMVESHDLLSQMANAGCKYCAMETSSHALDQCRTGGVDFAGAIFTNLTSDHLDYHKTRDNYFEAKAKLFISLSPNAPAIINADDEFTDKLIKVSGGKVLTYGIKNPADFFAKNIKLSQAGTDFIIITPSREVTINTPLIGLHNVYNILAAVGIAHEEGLSLGQIKRGVEKLENIPGRLESVNAGQNFTVLVDYAHTEDALINVLTILKEVCRGKIITVFGCGGDRDKTKRPKMGKVATEMSDFAIVTSDNPRSEDPQTIADEVVAGISKNNYKVCIDREDAVREAIKMAQPNDCVLLAGKGHEGYQIFKDKTIDFDDRKVARRILYDNKK